MGFWRLRRGEARAAINEKLKPFAMPGERTSTMNHHQCTIRILAFLSAISLISQPAFGQSLQAAKRSSQLIEMQGVPLSDAIRNLAAQLDFNYIFDARLCRRGYLAANPSINARWNISAEQALQKVLTEHGLIIVSNAATSIARIAGTNAVPQLPPINRVLSDTSAVIPELKIDNTLDKAIEDIASKAHITIIVDAKLSVPDAQGETAAADCDLWLHWRNVKPRQALAALLDNYELVMVENPTNSSVRILPRAQFEVQQGRSANRKMQP